MTDSYDELRSLTVPHQAEANCPTCDARWGKIKEVADDIAYDAVREYRYG